GKQKRPGDVNGQVHVAGSRVSRLSLLDDQRARRSQLTGDGLGRWGRHLLGGGGRSRHWLHSRGASRGRSALDDDATVSAGVASVAPLVLAEETAQTAQRTFHDAAATALLVAAGIAGVASVAGVARLVAEAREAFFQAKAEAAAATATFAAATGIAAAIVL